MDHPRTIPPLKFSGRSDGFPPTALFWNVLTVLFLIGGILIAVLIIQQRAKPVYTDIKPMSSGRSSVKSREVSVEDQWMPFESYAAVFAGRDIFTTEEEKNLQTVQRAELSTDLPAFSWGDGYQLMGVIVDEDPRAIVKILNPLGLQTLAIGDRLGDAALVGVEKDRAVFEYQTKRVELHFAENSVK